MCCVQSAGIRTVHGPPIYQSQNLLRIYYEVQKNYLRPINMQTTCGAQIHMHNRQEQTTE